MCPDTNTTPDKDERGPFADVPLEIRKRMARIRKANTKPELIVRSLAHRMGYRFRLHRSDLPGTPDLVFPSLRKIIFVHGCFWHRHDCKLSGKLPEKRASYWHPKLQRNVERDQKAANALAALGWEVLIIWECETKDLTLLRQRVGDFLRK